MKEITYEFIEKQRQAFLNDAAARSAANSVIANGALGASIKAEVQRSLPFTFSIDVWDGGVTDQHATGRCWAFAALNIVRHNMIRSLDMADKDFELSQSYIYFFDQLEKSSGFLNKMIELIELPLSDPKVSGPLRRPIMDNGMWYTFCRLADRYGVVPKYMMPDTQCCFDSKYVTRILEQKLKLAAKELRDAFAAGTPKEELYSLKERQLAEVFSIMTRFLGLPPSEVALEYRQSDGRYAKLKGLSPLEFYKRYGGVETGDYCFIINHPDPKYPFGAVYAEQPEACSAYDRRLNLDMETIKQLVIASLRGGDQVVMGCDVAKQSDKPSGYMSRDLLNYENVFGARLNFPDRASFVAYKGYAGATSGGHIMTFDGVELEADGRPLRWKVQNSYGPEMGIKGHYVMADSWFDMYVSSVVIQRRYMTPDLLAAYDAPPRTLEPGALF